MEIKRTTWRGQWVEFVWPFTFNGKLYEGGSAIILHIDGTRRAVTRSQLVAWLAGQSLDALESFDHAGRSSSSCVYSGPVGSSRY